jgi:hypothetical protein
MKLFASILLWSVALGCRATLVTVHNISDEVVSGPYWYDAFGNPMSQIQVQNPAYMDIQQDTFMDTGTVQQFETPAALLMWYDQGPNGGPPVYALLNPAFSTLDVWINGSGFRDNQVWAYTNNGVIYGVNDPFTLASAGFAVGVRVLVIFLVFASGMVAFMCYRLGRMRCLVPFLLVFGLGESVRGAAYVVCNGASYGACGELLAVSYTAVDQSGIALVGNDGWTYRGNCYGPQYNGSPYSVPGTAGEPCVTAATFGGCAPGGFFYVTCAGVTNYPRPDCPLTAGAQVPVAVAWVPAAVNTMYNITNNGAANVVYSVVGPNGNVLVQAQTLTPGGTASFSGFPAGSYLAYAPADTSSTVVDGNTIWDPITQNSSVGTGVSTITNWVSSGGSSTPAVPTVNGVAATNPPPVTINGGLVSAGDSNIVAAITSSGGSGSSSGGLNSSQAAALTNAAAADTSTNFTAPGNVLASTNVATGFPTFTALATTPASPSIEVPFSALNAYLPAGVDGFTDATLDWSTETFWPALIAQFRSFELLLVTLGFVFLAVRTVKGISS